MLAQYRSGRQAEALDTYRKTRDRLVDELGVDPSPLLQTVHQQILDGEAAAPRAVPAPRPFGSPPGRWRDCRDVPPASWVGKRVWQASARRLPTVRW